MDNSGRLKARIQQRINRIEAEWEYRYLRLVASEDWIKVFFFLGDFKEYCIKIVKEIIHKTIDIEELTHFDHRYSIVKPGEKMYLKDNIVFRIVKMRYQNGKYDLDGFKIMNQQMLTNNAVNNLLLMLLQQKTMKMHVPLTCMVDYLGYRAFCQADTTCYGSSTLQYGCNQDKLFKHNEEIYQMLRKIGWHLNIKPYDVKTNEGQKLTIPLSLNIQVHMAKMEKYDEIRRYINDESYLYTEIEKKPPRDELYLFNLYRIWPIFVEKNLEKNQGFLRPEYVLTWPRALSNSAFQNLSSNVDSQAELQLADACKTLKQDRLSQLSKRLDDSEIILVDSHGIAVVFHEYGISRRYMGAVAQRSRMSHVKTVLSIQMIAITLKKIFYSNCQNDEELKDSLVDFLNLVFTSSKQSEQFFKTIVYSEIADYYDYVMNDYPPAVPGGGLLHAICYHFGVAIKLLDYPFFTQSQQRTIFTKQFIGEFYAMSETFTMDTVELKTIVQEYKTKRRNQPGQCIAELEMIIAMNRGLNHKNTFTVGSHPEAIYYAQLAQIYFAREEYESAYEAAKNALQRIPQKHAQSVKPYCIMIKYESIKGRRGKSLEYYDETLSAIAFHLGANHPLQISAYNVIGFEFLRHNEPEKCQKILKKSFDVCTQTLGYLHVTCSQILLQLSTLPLSASIRLNFLLQCLAILQGLKAEEADIQSVSLMIANLYEQLGDSQGTLQYAKKANSPILTIKAADSLNRYEQVIALCSIYPESFEQTQFVVQKCFNAYTQLLDRLAKRILFKIFTASVDKLEKDKQKAYSQFKTKMYNEHKSVGVIIEQTMNVIMQNGKRIAESEDTLTDIEGVLNRMKDNRLMKMFKSFINFISIIDRQKVEMIVDFNAVFLVSSAKKQQTNNQAYKRY